MGSEEEDMTWQTKSEIRDNLLSLERLTAADVIANMNMLLEIE
jgi:hypothetical protein